MKQNTRTADGKIPNSDVYYVNSLYPMGNSAVNVTSKDVIIDTPAATITITQKETNK